MKLRKKALAVFRHYHQHVGQMTSENKVFLLVSDKKTYQALLEPQEQTMTDGIIDVNDFVMKNRDKYPELDNFLGFETDSQLQDAEMLQDSDVSPFGYLAHHELSTLLLGVKEGRFFQGRLNVSRLDLEEATITV